MSILWSAACRNSIGPVLSGKGPISETMRRLKGGLDGASIPHIYVNDVATNGYDPQRVPNEIELCVAWSHYDRTFTWLGENGFPRSEGAPAGRFGDSVTDVSVRLICAGRPVGLRPEQRKIKYPDPRDAVICFNLPVPSLERHIELRLGLMRLKDMADVVEFIRIHDLDESFAEKIHPVTRSAYLQCLDQKRDEDRYNPEIHDSPPDGPQSQADR